MRTRESEEEETGGERGNRDSGTGSEAVKRIINFYLKPNQRQQKLGQQRQGQQSQGQQSQGQQSQGQQSQGQKRPWEQDDLRLSLNSKKAKNSAGKEGGEKAKDRGTSGQGVANQSSGKMMFNNCTFHNVNFN